VYLAIYVGDADVVEIDYDYSADASTAEGLGGIASHSSKTEYGHGRILEFPDAVRAEKQFVAGKTV
jgi:hypothetical protein